jgi:hypothetical protein
MKIALHLTVDLPDPEQWTTTYGVEGTAAIREDVKSYIANAIAPDGSLAGNGEVDMTVTWK